MLTGQLIGDVAENWALREALNTRAFSSIVMFALVMTPLVKAVIVLQMKEA
jgi:hypothetical protein